MALLDLRTLFVRREMMVEAMALFLSRGGRKSYGKTMETLILKGVFIGFLNGLK